MRHSHPLSPELSLSPASAATSKKEPGTCTTLKLISVKGDNTTEMLGRRFSAGADSLVIYILHSVTQELVMQTQATDLTNLLETELMSVFCAKM